MNAHRENRNTNGENTQKTNKQTDKQSKAKPQARFKTKWSSSSAKFYTRKSLEKHTAHTHTKQNQLLSISSFLLLVVVFDLSKYNKTSDTCCSKTKRRKNNTHSNKK